jgi:hypothetical protein
MLALHCQLKTTTHPLLELNPNAAARLVARQCQPVNASLQHSCPAALYSPTNRGGGWVGGRTPAAVLRSTCALHALYGASLSMPACRTAAVLYSFCSSFTVSSRPLICLCAVFMNTASWPSCKLGVQGVRQGQRAGGRVGGMALRGGCNEWETTLCVCGHCCVGH